MSRFGILIVLVFTGFILSGCQEDLDRSDTTTDMALQCILDDNCLNLENIATTDEVFDVIGTYIDLQDTNLNVEMFDIEVERDSGKIEFEIDYKEPVGLIQESDLFIFKGILEVINQYLFDNNTAVDRIYLEYGITGENQVRMSQENNQLYVYISNYIDTSFNADISSQYPLIDNVLSDDDILEFSISMIYSDIHVIINYNPDLFSSVQLRLLHCETSEYCTDENKVAILEELNNLVDREIELK